MTTITLGRRLRQITSDRYIVIVDDVTIGEVYRDPTFGESHPWAARLTHAERRTSHSYTTVEVAAKSVWHYAGLKLRSKRVTDLTDRELLWLIECERGVSCGIGQSDAIGTAAKIGRHQDEHLFPLLNERRARERERCLNCGEASEANGGVYISGTGCPVCGVSA